MLCVPVSSGHRHSSYVDKYHKITLRRGYRGNILSHIGVHHTVKLKFFVVNIAIHGTLVPENAK